MRRPDTFYWDLELSHWLFTLSLGLALGVVLAGAWMVIRRSRRSAGPGAAVAFGGLALGALTMLLVWDVSPLSTVLFRLKPYLSAALPAAALVGALLLGAGLSFALVVGARQLLRGPFAPAAAIAFTAGIIALVLWRIDVEEQPDHPRHPVGVERQFVPASRVLSGLNVPTGIALAANGELAVVELQGAGFRLYAPEGDGFAERIKTRFPLEEQLMAFHVAFHPDYPRQPYVYATVEEQGPRERTLQLLRGRIEGSNLTWESLVRGLPNAQAEEGGNHHGSGITFCGGYLFLGTGDAESNPDEYQALTEPGVVRDEAQDLTSLRGKFLRWRLTAEGLEEAPVLGSEHPLYAFGVRNPFGVACDQRTGTLLVADNGPGGHDQIRLVPPASNHEWPFSTLRNNLAVPLFDSGRAQIAPTGIAWRAAGGGSELVMTAFQSRAVYLLPIAPDGRPGRLRLLAEPDTGAFAVAADEHGCVYFSDADSIWRLEDGRCER